MKQFLKENPTLAFGLGLPILLVLVFTLAAGIPNLTTTPPKYDVVFAVNDTSYNSEGVRLSVVNGKLEAIFIGECSYCKAPEIYRYNAAAGTIKRLAVNLPPEAKQTNNKPNDALKDRVLPVAVPELDNVTLTDSNPAPDGYEFTNDYNRYSSGGILPELFFSRSSRYDYSPSLQKGTYYHRLPLPKDYYSYSSTRFLGWIVP